MGARCLCIGVHRSLWNLNLEENLSIAYVPAQVKPPRVAESAVHMECVLRHQYPIINA